MDEINKIYNDLFLNFFKCIVFYLPKDFLIKVIDHSKDKSLESLLEYTNKEIVIDEKFRCYLVDDKKSAYSTVFTKVNHLNRNLLLLLNLKATFSEPGLDFIYNKYTEYLTGIQMTTQWLLNQAQKDIKNLSNDSLKAFELQLTYIKNHKEEVQKEFSKISSKYLSDSPNITNENFGVLFKNEINSKKINNSIFKNKVNDVFNRRDYIKDLTNHSKEQAQQYLLENIFQVDFSQLQGS